MADEEDVCVKIQQRCVIEFCVKLGKSGNETLEMLWQAKVVKHLAVLQYFSGGGTSQRR